ncbi:hypothetical protein A9Q94_05335 [Rhodobacterales bacterium 56_14_T64]|nr:hypothetical protein A9Q94_05335 [Rhodobacterales bacterium 56_14_T64]
MPRLIKRIATLLAVLIGVGIFAVWLLLSSSILSTVRGDLTARLLSKELGQVVRITGGVRVELGSVLHVVTDGLVLPSQAMPDVSLAEIGQLEFNVAVRDLLKGRLNLLDLQVAGAKLALVVDQDGTSSWSTAKTNAPRDTASVSPDPNGSSGPSKDKAGPSAGFLAGHKIQVQNSTVTYRDARNGLELDLAMTSLKLSQKDRSSPVVLQGAGTLNGQEMSLNGTFPQAQPFKLAAAFSQINVMLDGTPDQDGYDAGYSAALSVDISELGQLLDVLKLEKTVSGTGQISAVFKKSKGSARIEDLDVDVTLDGGQSLKLTGDLGELSDPSDVTLDTRIRLFSQVNQPPPTKTWLDLKLIGIDMQLIAQPDGVPQRRMVIETNGFVLDTSGEGPPPVSFSEVSRTPDGKLKIGKLALLLGPPEAQFVVLEGAIADVLQLAGINIEGTLAIPVASLIAPQLFQTSDVLGVVSGGFQLIGDIDELSLSDLNAESQGTDLWHLNVAGSIKNVLDFSDLALDITANVPSGAELLKALKLEPIETGPMTLTSKLSNSGTEWESRITIAVAESQLGFSLDLDVADPHPVVRGRIESDLIKVAHLRDIVTAALQVAKLNDLEQSESDGNTPADGLLESEDGKKTEPLVLPKPEQTDLAESEGGGAAGASDTNLPDPFRNVSLQPMGRSILMSGMDLSITIDLKNIEGAKGSSSLKSDLEMKDLKARLGPLKFEYDGAHFDISGSMDLNENPDILKLSGSTGGWDFGEIMQSLRFKKSASGVLNANFDVSGSHASVRDFLATMNGNANVSMKHGRIDSQLLDLAGLGVIPWLFSKDRGPTVNIVCARAPLHISNGRISTKQTVMETDRVQIVLLGNVDLKHKSLDIAGQPRRIGKPLSRSPWPFTAVGPMAKPKIKVKDGPRRLRRSDGASSMPERRQLCIPDILQLK